MNKQSAWTMVVLWVALVVPLAVLSPARAVASAFGVALALVLLVPAAVAGAREIRRRRTGVMGWELMGGYEHRRTGVVSPIVLGPAVGLPPEVADATRFQLRWDGGRGFTGRVAVWARDIRIGELHQRPARQVAAEMRRHGVDHLLVEGELTSRYDGYVLLPRDFADAAPELSDGPARAFPVPVPTSAWGEAAEKVDAVRADFFIPELTALYPDGRPPADSRRRTLSGLRAEIFPTGRASVGVFVDDHQIGWLGADECATHGDVLTELARSGHSLSVRAGVRLGVGRRPTCRVRLWLPPADQILPPRRARGARNVILPPGSRIQVTGEQDHVDDLQAVLAGRQKAPVAAELHLIGPAGRGRPVVGVRVDGREAGRLTAVSGAHFTELLQACLDRGLHLVCRATVRGNQLKTDVVLNAAKGGDLSNDWIESNVLALERP